MLNWKCLVDETKITAYQAGIKPLEFDEMTLKEIGEYVEQYFLKKHIETKENAEILFSVVQNFTFGNKKMLSFNHLFPHFKSEDDIILNQNDYNNLSDREISRIGMQKWAKALGL